MNVWAPMTTSAPDANARAVRFGHAMIKTDAANANTITRTGSGTLPQAPRNPPLETDAVCESPAAASVERTYGKTQPAMMTTTAVITPNAPGVANHGSIFLAPS